MQVVLLRKHQHLQNPTGLPKRQHLSSDVFRPPTLLLATCEGHHAIGALFVAAIDDIHPRCEVAVTPRHADVFADLRQKTQSTAGGSRADTTVIIGHLESCTQGCQARNTPAARLPLQQQSRSTAHRASTALTTPHPIRACCFAESARPTAWCVAVPGYGQWRTAVFDSCPLAPATDQACWQTEDLKRKQQAQQQKVGHIGASQATTANSLMLSCTLHHHTPQGSVHLLPLLHPQ